MGIEDRIGFDFTGGHEHCQAAPNQNNSVTAFVDKFMRGKDANTDIHVKPTNGKGFKIDNYADWIDWETPEIPYVASNPDTSKIDTSKVDTSVTDTSITSCGDGRIALPKIGMHVMAGRIEVDGAPAGAIVKLYDVRGNVVATLGATGGDLPKAKGRLLAIVESAAGVRLMTKAIVNTGI